MTNHLNIEISSQGSGPVSVKINGTEFAHHLDRYEIVHDATENNRIPKLVLTCEPDTLVINTEGDVEITERARQENATTGVAVAKIRAVRALHVPMGQYVDECAACGGYMPCPTIQALNGTEQDPDDA